MSKFHLNKVPITISYFSLLILLSGNHCLKTCLVHHAATSIPEEHIFSHSKLSMQPRRAKMSAKMMCNLVMLNSNFSLSKSRYFESAIS